MTNKISIGILIYLVILSTSLCYYSYTLNKQIYSLNRQMAVLHQEQSAGINDVRDELTTLRGETLNGFSILQDEIQGEIDETLIRIDTIEDEIEGTATELSQSVIYAREVYQRVSKSIVRISNGEMTVGSGFILDTEAHVVTAQHVVENLSEIYVILPDGRISQATNTGSCQHSDIAVLTLKDELFIEPLKLEDSAIVRIGEPVATIGNPFDLTETLTTGIVSQTNRFVEIEWDSQTRWVANLIQFDAAVNLGSSGSPLVNSKGGVIGMVTARVKPDEGDGIYYAVSSNNIKRVSASLIAQGFFEYPWLGIKIVNLTPQIMQSRGIDTANGVLVNDVLDNSPASAAGIKVDDIILAVDGITIRDAGDLTSYIGEYKSPDEVVTIALMRDTTKLELSLKIGRKPS